MKRGENMPTTLIESRMREIKNLVAKRFENTNYQYSIYSENGNIYISISHLDDYKKYMIFKLGELEGCCAILISYNTYISEALRGKGYARLLMDLKKEIARLLGYSYLICTTLKNNSVEKQVLKRTGWKKIKNLYNSRTGNHLEMYICDVKES